MGSVLGVLPGHLLTRDQVKLLKSDNVVSEAAEKAGRTLAGIGIQARSIDTILASYLWRFRPAGQFTRIA
jgi:NADH dehydrogenase